VLPIESTHQTGHPCPCIGGGTWQAAGKILVVFDLQLAQLALEDLQITIEIDGVIHERLTEQEPDERQPKLARVRQRSAVDEHLAVVALAHQLKQIAQGGCVGGIERRPVT